MPHVRICAGGRWVTGVPTATGLKPTARLRTNRACRGRSERQPRKGKEKLF